MRIFIAAIDGLEYNLVTKWKLKNLLQIMYGKHDIRIAIKKDDPIYTPLIWASFLLGHPSYKYGFDMEYIQSKKAEYGYNTFLRAIFKIRLLVLGSRKLGIREYLSKIGLFNYNSVKQQSHKIEVMPPDLIEKTFLATAARKGYRVWYRNIPSLPNDKYAKYRAYLYKYFDSNINERISILNNLYEESESDLKDAIQAYKNNYDLIMYYTPLIDEAHHMLYRPGKPKLMLKLYRYYKLIDNQILTIKNTIDSDTLLLIVSDHGYDPSIHEHSDYGFWSTNIEISPIPNTILDFRSIIEKYLYES